NLVRGSALRVDADVEPVGNHCQLFRGTFTEAVARPVGGLFVEGDESVTRACESSSRCPIEAPACRLVRKHLMHCPDDPVAVHARCLETDGHQEEPYVREGKREPGESAVIAVVALGPVKVQRVHPMACTAEPAEVEACPVHQLDPAA